MLGLPPPSGSEELEGVEGAGPPGSPSSAFLSADLGDLFNFWKLLISFFLFFFLTFLGALGLLCRARAFSRCGEKGRLLGVRTCFPPPSAAPLVADTGSRRTGQWLQRAGLIALRHAGSNPDPSHLQADSFSLYIREAPTSYCFLISKRAITLSTPHSTVVVENPS